MVAGNVRTSEKTMKFTHNISMFEGKYRVATLLNGKEVAYVLQDTFEDAEKYINSVTIHAKGA